MKKKDIVEFINHNLDIISGDKPEIDTSNAITRQKSTTDQIVQTSTQSDGRGYYQQMGFYPFMDENMSGDTKDIITESKLIEDYISTFCNYDNMENIEFSNPKYGELCTKICEIFSKTTSSDKFLLISKLLDSFDVGELPSELKFSLIKKFKSNNPTISEE
jgi:hypothetical protein